MPSIFSVQKSVLTFQSWGISFDSSLRADVGGKTTKSGDVDRCTSPLFGFLINFQRQPGCSQPHPISITPDLCASLQYSLQYLLPSAVGQSQVACAHLICLSSAMLVYLLFQ